MVDAEQRDAALQAYRDRGKTAKMATNENFFFVTLEGEDKDKYKKALAKKKFSKFQPIFKIRPNLLCPIFRDECSLRKAA